MKKLIFFLFLLLPFPLYALQPMDFNKGFSLEITDPSIPLQKLELPYAVYDAGFRQDLGDIRIFNGGGDTVPTHLRKLSASRKVESRESEVLLPVFPMNTEEEESVGDDFRMAVKTSESGTVISVEHGKGEQQKTGNTLLLDASALAEPLNGLHFELRKPTASLFHVSIKGSDDLSSWQDAGNGALARIEHENGQILKNRIPLSGHPWKYYLIRSEGDLAILGKIYGVSGIEVVSQSDTRRWDVLQGKKVEDGLYEYTLPPGLPVSFLDLAKNENAILGVRILVPDANAADGWKEVRHGSLFRLDMEGESLKSDPLPLPGPMHQFRIAMEGVPVPLLVGWTPHELIFMPQGPEPFLLAVGNPNMAPEHLLTPMISSSENLKTGTAFVSEKAVPLAGHKVLEPPAAERDYKTWILWGILGLGVLLLGVMAWSLVKGLKTGSQE